ncbi:MAG TPA: hypothetical protein PKE27_08175 [Povalibacter sp.]|uniref:hypothetical protein n=1 Tax=Povalibacter sp. TaxID=1962978 RepID=UPI002B7110AA|nr:hypothetical protein [Povalibacter sp.]HMN44533.1 hypothetical protein [Povalibacter sp.]
MAQPIAESAESIPDLLLPVDEADLVRLQSPSKYGLRHQAYFAKRYQIVRINFALLETAGQTFDVAAFPDTTLRMVARDVAGIPSGENLREWTGEIVSPAIPPDSGVDSPDVLHPPVNFWIHTGALPVPVRVAREIEQAGGKSVVFGALPDQDPHAFTKIDVQTLSGRWFVPALNAAFVIQPIEDDPRFHIFYEADFDKIPQGTHPGNAMNEEKLRRMREFLDELDSERRAAEEARSNR